MLATLKRNQADNSERPPAVSAKREDVLKLRLSEYLEWVQPLRAGFLWAATFLADLHIFDQRSVPYAKQLVPMATLRVVLGRRHRSPWSPRADHSVVLVRRPRRALRQRQRDPVRPGPGAGAGLGMWQGRRHSAADHSGRGLRGVPAALAADPGRGGVQGNPRALSSGDDATDWMYDKTFDKVQYVDMNVDIHHIFPYRWCLDHGIDDERRESIVNKTPLSASTNRKIGGVAPSTYMAAIEKAAGIPPEQLEALVSSHRCDPRAMRSDDFDAFFVARREALVNLVEKAMGKTVQRDASEGEMQESADQFDAADAAVIPDEEESYGDE